MTETPKYYRPLSLSCRKKKTIDNGNSNVFGTSGNPIILASDSSPDSDDNAFERLMESMRLKSAQKQSSYIKKPHCQDSPRKSSPKFSPLPIEKDKENIFITIRKKRDNDNGGTKSAAKMAESHRKKYQKRNSQSFDCKELPSGKCKDNSGATTKENDKIAKQWVDDSAFINEKKDQNGGNKKTASAQKNSNINNYYFQTPQSVKRAEKAESFRKVLASMESSGDDSDDVTNTPSRSAKDSIVFLTPSHKWLETSHMPSQEVIKPHAAFLRSLSSEMADKCANSEASVYVKSFFTLKEQLALYLFKIFNEIIFSNELPENLKLVWNSRMTHTAGLCRCKRDRETLKKTALIELAPKLLTSADRLRDTLIHEMCHAATWVINEERESHGYFWRYWAQRATVIFPDLPAITRCHNYDTNVPKVKCARSTFVCRDCGYRIKMPRIEEPKCPNCRGPLVVQKQNRSKVSKMLNM